MSSQYLIPVTLQKPFGKGLYHIRLKNLQYIIDIILGMDVQVDGLGKVKAEDTHDRLCIYDVSSGHKIKIIIELSDIIYE